jgi:transcriptional regulator with XRE-family HTH domain
MIFRQALGEVIRETRTEKKLTLRTVAADGCLALGYLSELERGQKEQSSEILDAVARGLGVEPHELVFKAALRMSGVEIPNTIETIVDEYADLR